MFAAAFLVTIVLVVVLGYFRFCAPPAKEAGEQQTTQQTTTQQAARYQQAQNPAILATALFVFVVLVFVLVFIDIRFCAPLAKEAGEQQATHPTTQQAARYQQAQNPAILATALLVFVVLVFVLVLLPGPQSRRRCPRCPSRPVTCGRTSPAAPCARRGDWQA
jgi:NADH:ubiquinone oxidoreductase subunit 3 (subunit A)